MVPPFKVSDLPYTDSGYRMYKMQFRAPPNVVVHVEAACGQRYECWGRYISGYYRAYFFHISGTGFDILIPVHSWRSRLFRHWAGTLRALTMRFRIRKRTAWLDRALSRRGKWRQTLTATAINPPLAVFMRHLALPLLADISPYSLPFFGQLLDSFYTFPISISRSPDIRAILPLSLFPNSLLQLGSNYKISGISKERNLCVHNQ